DASPPVRGLGFARDGNGLGGDAHCLLHTEPSSLIALSFANLQTANSINLQEKNCYGHAAAEYQMSMSIPMRSVRWRGLPMASSLGALGVVFGDIGTSPLYALREAVKAASVNGAVSPQAVTSVVSLIIWSLILIISLKYAILIMRADNRGEGGIVALLAILRTRYARARTWRGAVLVIGLLGAALLYGDGAITPAISVLSALEGLKVDAPALAPVVVPTTLVVLIALFAVQRRGTDFIGGIFGPIMLAWFAVIAILGVRGIMLAPEILAALNPLYAIDLVLHASPLVAFAVLGATFLA